MTTPLSLQGLENTSKGCHFANIIGSAWSSLHLVAGWWIDEKQRLKLLQLWSWPPHKTIGQDDALALPIGSHFFSDKTLHVVRSAFSTQPARFPDKDPIFYFCVPKNLRTSPAWLKQVTGWAALILLWITSDSWQYCRDMSAAGVASCLTLMTINYHQRVADQSNSEGLAWIAYSRSL